MLIDNFCAFARLHRQEYGNRLTDVERTVGVMGDAVAQLQRLTEQHVQQQHVQQQPPASRPERAGLAWREAAVEKAVSCALDHLRERERNAPSRERARLAWHRKQLLRWCRTLIEAAGSHTPWRRFASSAGGTPLPEHTPRGPAPPRARPVGVM